MQDVLAELVESWGYLGLALAVFLTNATLFVGIPTPVYVVIAVALGLNPIVVTLVAGIASAAGETTGYVVGLTGKLALEKSGRTLGEWKEKFDRYGFWALVAIAALPFPPDDIAGIIAGTLGYEYWKFFLATFIGKTIKYGATVALTLLGMHVVSSVL